MSHPSYCLLLTSGNIELHDELPDAYNKAMINYNERSRLWH